jgi:hypothetical protein
MSNETDRPDAEAQSVSSDSAPPAAVQKSQPGLISGIGSILCGLIGFGIPVLGILVAGVGIWLGILAILQARRTAARSSTICGIIGIALSALCIVFWVCAILFESYH